MRLNIITYLENMDMMHPSKKKIISALPLLGTAFVVLLALSRSDLLWFILGIVSLLSIYGLMKVESHPRLKFVLVTLILINLFLGIIGLSKYVGNPLQGVGLPYIVIVSLLAFTIIFNFHHLTSFRSNYPFTLFFILMFSLSVGNLAGIGEFFSDQYFGTNFLESNHELMLQLLIISAGSCIMVLLFWLYLGKSKLKSIKSLTSPLGLNVKIVGKEMVNVLYSIFGNRGRAWLPKFSLLLQIGIVLFAIYAFYERNSMWFFTAVISLGLTKVPFFFTRRTKMDIPPSLNLWISSALFIHVLGEVRGYYDHVWWWDIVTHFYSAALLSILAFAIMLAISRRSTSLDLPLMMVPVVVILFALMMGVVWEIFEFCVDLLWDVNMQYGLQDTVHDMVINTFGAVVASMMGYRYFVKEDGKR